MASSSSFIRPEDFWRQVGLRAGQKVAHLGCGAGFFLIPAARLVGKDGSAIGVDLMANLLAEVENRARRNGLDSVVHTIRADLETTKGSQLPSGSVDVVLVANILHQAHPEAILSEARRIVASNGRVVVVEWGIYATPFGPLPEKRISKEKVILIAEKYGLQLQQEIDPSPYHYGLIFGPVSSSLVE